jgi:putative membrane protein
LFMKSILGSILFLFLLTACNNNSKDTVEKADSTNQARQDSGLDNNATNMIDEGSSAFLVKIANSGMAEVRMTEIAQQKATLPAVRDFAAMLHRDHSAVNEQVKSLASQKNVALPDSISDDKQKDIDRLDSKKGKNLDKEFIDMMVKNHEAGVDLFDKAQLDTKDPDVRALAGKTLPTLKMHLDSARALQKKYW